MKRFGAGLALIVAMFLASAVPAGAAEQVPIGIEAEHVPVQNIARVRHLDVDTWINKDEGGIYRPGESMRVYFRTNADCYVLVFNIDTDGYVHLIYPYGPGDPPMVEGGRPYRIPSRSDPYDLVADGPEGVEYVVAVASPYPFENLPWYLSADRADGDDDQYGDDDDDDTNGGYLAGDPYVGIDRIVRRIAPRGREDLVATNETYFYIGRRVEYPRYVCADCHYHPYYFDPYLNACSVFEIRIDATWAHYAPIRFGNVRPRYIYRVRSTAPTRYRQWKEQWSSLDGKATLRTRFLPERDARMRRSPEQRTRPTPPEFRQLRRYREGRFWGGRDQILRLRERRDQTQDQPGWGNRERPRDQQPGWGNRERPRDQQPGWGNRERPRDRTQEEQRREPPPQDRGWRGRERPPEDRGNQDNRDDRGRGQDRREREDRGNQGDRGKNDQGDRGNRDQGDRGHRDQDQGDRGHRDQGDRQNRDRDDRGDGGHRGHGRWR